MLCRFLSVAAATLIGGAAWAGDGFDGSLSANMGLASSFDPQPEAFRFGVEGEAQAFEATNVELGIVLPVTIEGSALQSDIGIDAERMAVEVTPALRVRGFQDNLLRPYIDGGIGFVASPNEIEGWYGPNDSENNVGLMTSAGVGLEIGGIDDGALYAIFEPATINIYAIGEKANARYSGNLGLGAKF